jgi:putative transposase
VDHLRASYSVSIRRATKAFPMERSSYHDKARRPSQAPLCKRIREIAETRVRNGYRRIHVLLQREGWPVNHKRIYRLCKEEGLQLRNKTPKRKADKKSSY